MKHSIRRQFAGIFIGLMAGTILLCWFLNSSLLEKYYISNKQKVLLETYEGLRRAVEEDTLNTEAFDLQLQQDCEKYNLSLLVLDANSRLIKNSDSASEFIKQQLLKYIFMQTDESIKVMEQTEEYVIQHVADPLSRMEYIEIWGVLGKGNFFIVRTALEGIQDSVAIANRFLAYVGICAAIASGIIIWFVSRRITTPILQLADISARMTRLDFGAHYKSSEKNEIDLLGENINRLSETLEKTISELKTANNELTRDIEKKNEADAMRSEFVSNVSHELKTPIALIQGYAEGLQAGIGDDPESRDFYCDVIVDEAGRMNEMVKKLLTLNQLEFGYDVVSMERFDIRALVHNYLQSAEILAKQNQITLKQEKGAPLYVWGDEFKIEEVLMNYFSNAVNHCEGEKVIEVKVEQIGRHARVSVSNTGTPIPEESLPHIWEKFYKVDKARTRAYGGSGVGLSIVKAIMESMNQTFGAENFDCGVTFWFELELVEEGETAK